MEKVGILLTGHPHQQIFMLQGVLSWLGWTGGPIVLAYDHDRSSDLPWESLSPPLTHVVCSGIENSLTNKRRLGHRKGELYMIKIGSEKLRDLGCEYIFKSAADTTFYRWRNLSMFADIMEGNKDADLIPWKETAHFFGKTDSICRITEDIELESWLDTPLATSAESWFGESCVRKNLKKYDIRPDNPTNMKATSWLSHLFGRVHVQGEYAVNVGTSVSKTWKFGRIWQDDESDGELDVS